MANTIQILNPADGTYYSVTITLESAVTLGGETGAEQYYIRVSTSQKDAEGNTILDQILMEPDIDFGTDLYSVAVRNAISKIMDLVGNIGTYELSSSSSSVWKNWSSSSSRNISSSSSSVLG